MVFTLSLSLSLRLTWLWVMAGIGFGLEIERLVTCIYLEFACNLFVALCREEIQRIKASNPDISHREAFSTAAKNVSGE